MLLVWLAIFTSGCATLATYEVNEAELEGYLQKAVVDFDRKQLEAGSPFSVSLKDAKIKVGPDNRDVVQLDVAGEAAFNAVITKIPLNLALKIEGTPIYSGKDKAVYIKRLRLIDSNFNSSLLRGSFGAEIQPVAKAIVAALGSVLEEMPVYRLDESDPRQRLLANMPVDVVVGQGVLRIVPRK
ncbi:conserved hypothetical protein [gamma proteobacterium HdN1]|nr:conserved hypothetical protein [gamma proteobacterium HdN1]